ncbi:hypothetical protein Tcan_08093 [Toxocara canis]|uniref:Uncharacterized protein n=2 Tax=Toxocara canis TaxID=6265 RepID=A0A0B2UPX4_TOXCA|nr:hypothetical protein Tcan_08093 [Toxocara canis]VDM47148.1 unnamed protein product [Toxocara canis]
MMLAPASANNPVPVWLTAFWDQVQRNESDGNLTITSPSQCVSGGSFSAALSNSPLYGASPKVTLGGEEKQQIGRPIGYFQPVQRKRVLLEWSSRDDLTNRIGVWAAVIPKFQAPCCSVVVRNGTALTL